MLDCLVIIVDQFADSEGLPAMGHLKEKNGIPFLATIILYSEATLSREHSRSCCTEHSLQRLSSSTETCEVVLPLNARSPDSP